MKIKKVIAFWGFLSFTGAALAVETSIWMADSYGSEMVYRSGTSIVERYHKGLGALSDEEQAFALQALNEPKRSEGFFQSTKFPLRSHYPSEEFQDLAERILKIAEECWEVQVTRWGFPPPPPDCGYDDSDDMDIHIVSLPAGVGGYAAFRCYDESTPYTVAASFIGLSDALPEAFLRSAVAHEFNHVLQNAIDYWESITFKEYTSTWAMEWMYPEDDQYFQFLKAYQRNPHLPMNHFSQTNTYQYGAGIFLHFLSEYYGGGDPQIVLDVWNACRQTEFYNAPDFIDGLKVVIPEYSKGVDTFADMMAEYAVWRTITSSRDDGVHFADGCKWAPGAEVVMDTEIDLGGSWPKTMTPDKPPLDYGFSYCRLVNPVSAPDGILLEFSGDEAVDWVVVLVECRNNHTLHIKHRMEISDAKGKLMLTPVMLENADEFIVGVVNLSNDEFDTNQTGEKRDYALTLRKAAPKTSIRLWTDSPMTGPGMDYVLNLEMEYYGQPTELDLWLFVEIEGCFFSLFTNSDGIPVPVAIPLQNAFTVTTPIFQFTMPELETEIPIRWHTALLSDQTVNDYRVIRSNLLPKVRL
ncbi:MAG: hypothetical protein WBM02_09625 [bacterium]